MITGRCPKEFCQYNLTSSYLQNEYKLPQNASKSLLDAYVCGQHRTGKLCGSCCSTHSVFFHSTNYQCKLNDYTCRLSVLLYFTSELLPVTVLFLIVIVYDVQFTCGALNSLLFFVQVMDAMIIDVQGIIETHAVINFFIKANRFIYGVFNLNFFTLNELSFCLWSTATSLDILAFKYVTISYSLMLIIVTVAVMKFCNPWMVKKLLFCIRTKVSIKTSIIHGLVAFLVICYSQNTKVSLSILTPGHIHWIGSTKNHKVSRVVYLNGDITFMGTEHLKYAIPAILFTVVFLSLIHI